jgi:hypothetical protein
LEGHNPTPSSSCFGEHGPISFLSVLLWFIQPHAPQNQNLWTGLVLASLTHTHTHTHTQRISIARVIDWQNNTCTWYKIQSA